jgi:hypothetical protein
MARRVNPVRDVAGRRQCFVQHRRPYVDMVRIIPYISCRGGCNGNRDPRAQQNYR